MTAATKAAVNRLDLGDGDWADVVQKPTHGAVNRLYKSFSAASKEDALYLDLMSEAILAFTAEWSVRLPDGTTAALSPDGVAAAPWDKVKPVFDACMAIFQVTQVISPNA